MEATAASMCKTGEYEVVLYGKETDKVTKKELKQSVRDEIRVHLHPTIAVEHTFDAWANILTWMAKHLCTDYTVLTNNPVELDMAPDYITRNILCPTT